MSDAKFRSPAQADRVLLVTRLVSIFVVPFLLLGFVLLYLLPDHTKDLFAWTIQPRLSAMMLGGAYLVGAYFFVRSALASRWHTVAIGFLPVSVFALLMAVATILHWDRFNHTHPAFYAWAFIYFTTVVLVPLAWMLNRHEDPHTPDAGEPLVPAGVRRTLLVVGCGTVFFALLFYVLPSLMIAVWPWHLTTLTARVVAAMVALTGVGVISVALDARWSALRIALQSFMIAPVTGVIALAVAWSDLRPLTPLAWLLGGAILLVSLVGAPLLYLRMEHRRSHADLSAHEASRP